MRNNQYDLQDFKVLLGELRKSLYAEEEPICCEWHNRTEIVDHLVIEWPDGSTSTHVAEACNLASIIASIERLLIISRSHIACAELSEVLLLQLDVLREYVRDAVQTDQFKESDSELAIRMWAGFLKHPRDFVRCHRCRWMADEFNSPSVDTAFLLAWENFTIRQKEAARREFGNKLADVQLPEVQLLVDFIKCEGDRIRSHLDPTVSENG